MKWIDHTSHDRSWLRLIPAHELTTAYRVVAARQTPAPRLRPITPQVTHFGRARRSRSWRSRARAVRVRVIEVVTAAVVGLCYGGSVLLIGALLVGRLP